MPNGYILYEGPSLLDNQPIVVIATGLTSLSTNRKTGAMVQFYILRSDMPPQEAVASGDDQSICGRCKHRGDGTGKGRSCYVNLGWGPRSVYGAYKRGSYERSTNFEHFRDRLLRFGSYGDPAAAPAHLWQDLAKVAKAFTSYTHQWRQLDPAVWAPLVMASVDTEQEMRDAHALGFRTFRVTPNAHENIKGLEIVCPASEEAGKRTTCEQCRACMGTSAKARVSIQIAAHGAGKRHVQS